MQSEDRQAHWQTTYAAKGECEVSWFQDSPQPSLALIEEFAPPSAADDLARTLGATFRPVSTRRHTHVAPWGTPQASQFSVFRHQPRPMP